MNEPTFFFYDLETSGLNAREDRIMQFAGQRTDLNLNKIGNPVNILVKMTDDTLPSPQAIMVTKITPQSTLADGLTEAEFCQYLTDEIFTENTCVVGYNSVRFDDEFMRHLFWRNFRDPYEWQWADGRSRWDLLDVVRLTRALRPEGINWPVVDGKATNRLELLTKENGISHEHAHDALSDVEALVSVTKLIKEKQPQLYDYLYKIRGKKAVQQLINLENPKPFVYACGRYPAEYEKTSVAYPLAPGRNGNILVYDLRYDLDELDPEKSYPVVKELCYNKCPAVAPLGVLENADGWKKISLTKEQVEQNLAKLLSRPDFAEKMRSSYEDRPEFPPAPDPESALYDSFTPDADKVKIAAVRNADANKLADFHPDFTDERLPELLLHYKAKNYPSALDEAETKKWEEYRIARLNRQAPAFATAMAELQAKSADEFILEELNLWYQSLQTGDY
ncbi:exodeoxyribonuclease I [Candidatus Saccharibacteria bacterium]|nr:exodeoxyribonuclease I [Candidatus Saccharibacteria bacterium]